MRVTTHERPGVYSTYQVSSVTVGGRGGRAVGIAAMGDSEQMGNLVRVTTHEEAAAVYGAGAVMTELIRLALLNGASAVTALEVLSEDMYKAAFDRLCKVEDAAVILCDSTKAGVQIDLVIALRDAAKAGREHIGVAACNNNESITALQDRAKGANSERVVVLAPSVKGESGVTLAAAFAGAVAGEPDPAVPMSGVLLQGVGVLGLVYQEAQIDQLIQSGVTPLEMENGQVSVVRAVSSKTTTNKAPDATWRDLTTVRIVDDVIPAVRAELRARFRRAKNTEQTRGAIRSQVVMVLEKKVEREVITSYGQVAVSPLEDDPTVCLVEFSFAVAHGLNQIWLSAHITI